MNAAAGSRTVRWAVRLYGRATILLPAQFRAEYGDELVSCFERIAADARRRGRWSVAGVTFRSILDLARRAPKQHLAAARAGVLGGTTGVAGTLQDVNHAARRLRRRPSFAATTILTLALGIATTTSVFSLVHGVILRPLDYPESDRIVVVDHGGAGLGIDRGLGVAYGFYRLYDERARTAGSMAMYITRDMTLTGRGDPVRLPVAAATTSLPEVLKVTPMFGRWYTEEEGSWGSTPAVVLSYRVWRDRFGADRRVIGTTAELDGQIWEVVGVMPESFAFPNRDIAMWIPRVVPRTGIGGWNDLAVARLVPGATPEALEAELTSLLPLLRESNDDPARVEAYLDDAQVTPRIVTLKESLIGDIRSTLWVLLGTVGLVLLIAVANVANLLLVRAEEGQRESAVRTALGADRARLIRGHMAETLLIAGAAGAVGISAAAFGVRLLRLRAPVDVPRLDEVGLNPAVIGVALGTCLAAALLLGLVPALRRRGDLTVDLKEASRRATSNRRRLRGRNVLVATQVALALVLLIGSGLLFRTFRELRSVDLGFSERQALTFEVGLPLARYPDRAAAKAFHDELLPRLGALPGVEAAAMVGPCLPLSASMCWGETLRAEGQPDFEGEVPPVVGTRIASNAYFTALGIAVRGRTFTPADEVPGSERVAILSEATAAAYFPDTDALGRRVSFGDDEWYRVVGVARDVRSRVANDDFTRAIYLPNRPDEQAGPSPQRVSYVLTTAVPPTGVTPAVRAAIADIDATVPLASVRTLEQVVASATAPTTFALTLIGLAAVIALLLGAIGVYAVVAYTVSRRTSEIGVRMALGAGTGEVRRMVLRQGAAVVLAGIAIGLVVAIGLTRVMSGMLYGVSATDPASYVLLTALMLAITGMALYLPARRASRVHPLEALRGD